jgi:hypothetical protein
VNVWDTAVVSKDLDTEFGLAGDGFHGLICQRGIGTSSGASIELCGLAEQGARRPRGHQVGNLCPRVPLHLKNSRYTRRLVATFTRSPGTHL